MDILNLTFLSPVPSPSVPLFKPPSSSLDSCGSHQGDFCPTVSFWKCRSDHVSLLFHTFQWLFISLRRKSKILPCPMGSVGLSPFLFWTYIISLLLTALQLHQPSCCSSHTLKKFSSLCSSHYNSRTSAERLSQLPQVMQLRCPGARTPNQISQTTSSVLFYSTPIAWILNECVIAPWWIP